MPDRSDDYQLPSWPRTKLDPDLWNAVMGDIAARLKARELLEASFEVLQEQGIQAALDYIQVSIAPQLAGLKQDIINAQAKIDEILTGNAPNAQKLGGQLPSYYAKAQATAEALGALAVDISLLNTAVNARLLKSGGDLTGGLSARGFALYSQTADYKYLDVYTGGNRRWALGTSNAPESGGDVGSDLELNRFADNGTYLGQPIKVSRKTGQVSLANDLLVLGNTFATHVISRHDNGFRTVSGNFGQFWRFDGASLWLMFTNSGDQYGNYNNLRPMQVSCTTGVMTIADVRLGNKATAADITAGTENKFPDAKAVKEGIAANVPPGFGVGQTWQQPARSIGTSYQNTTGKPIQVYVAWSEQNYIERQFQISTDNVNWFTIRNFAGEVWAIIPTGHYYRIASQGVLAYWRELR